MIEFLASNCLWIVFIVAELAMHRYGGCGAHGHHHINTNARWGAPGWCFASPRARQARGRSRNTAASA